MFFSHLAGDEELAILMGLLGIERVVETPLLLNEDFSAFSYCSWWRFSQLSKDDFDNFYEEWLRRSGREASTE